MVDKYRDINGFKLGVGDLVLYSKVSSRQKNGNLIWCRIYKLLENGSILLKHAPSEYITNPQLIIKGIMRSTSPSLQIYKYR